MLKAKSIATAADPRTVRGADAVWTENGEMPGELVTREVRVLFYSPTIKELREAREEVEQHFKDHPDDPYYLSEVLKKRLHSLPDFKVGVGQPKPLTIEWIEDQDLKNLEAIHEAIKADLNPKSTPGL